MDRQRYLESLRHGNLIFDSLACSMIGATSLGLFFFVIDALDGRALYTPALLGSVLFHGTPAEAVQEVRISTVAAYSVVHLLAFATIGFVASLLVHAADLVEDKWTPILTGILGIEMAFFMVASLWLPGVIDAIGAARIIVGNAIAGAGIGVYLLYLRPGIEWHAEDAERDETLQQPHAP